MTKFFKKVGRFLKKIWEIIKKVIATILAIIIVTVLIGVVLSVLPADLAGSAAGAYWKGLSNVAAYMTSWFAQILPSGPGAWFTRASKVVKGWVAGEWGAAAAVALGVGFGTMPGTMEWAIRRQVDGAKYVGETVIEAAGDLAETAVEVTAGVVATAGNAILSSPILLIAAAGLLYWKFGRGPQSAPVNSQPPLNIGDEGYANA